MEAPCRSADRCLGWGVRLRVLGSSVVCTKLVAGAEGRVDHCEPAVERAAAPVSTSNNEAERQRPDTCTHLTLDHLQQCVRRRVSAAWSTQGGTSWQASRKRSR